MVSESTWERLRKVSKLSPQERRAKEKSCYFLIAAQLSRKTRKGNEPLLNCYELLLSRRLVVEKKRQRKRFAG
jgi:hypothetical protein